MLLLMRKADVDLVALADLVGRIFPPRGSCTIRRTDSGASTQVYRLERGAGTFYLRVAEEREASLAPEVYVHQVLRARGVHVPAVVHYEPLDARLERSVMVTTAVAGTPVGHAPLGNALPAILRAAGRDLAGLNSLPVHGFGWIARDTAQAHVRHLEAEHATFARFALEHLDSDLALLGQEVLSGSAVDTLRRLIAEYTAWHEAGPARLAHGDFDLTHIYQHDGVYSGIIDFGEIRGTDPFYDLGHFALHDGELRTQMVSPLLLQGYADAVELPPGYERRIALASVFIGVRALARQVERRPSNAYRRHLIGALRRAVASLDSARGNAL